MDPKGVIKQRAEGYGGVMGDEPSNNTLIVDHDYARLDTRVKMGGVGEGTRDGFNVR